MSLVPHPRENPQERSGDSSDNGGQDRDRDECQSLAERAASLSERLPSHTTGSQRWNDLPSLRHDYEVASAQAGWGEIAQGGLLGVLFSLVRPLNTTVEAHNGGSNRITGMIGRWTAGLALQSALVGGVGALEARSGSRRAEALAARIAYLEALNSGECP